MAAQVSLREPEPQARDPWLWARLLGWLGLLLLVLIAVWSGWRWISAPERFPLRAVRLDGALSRVSEPELREAILPYLDRGMLGLDVEGIRAAVEALPWVARAGVRRRWPGTLVLDIVERSAVARWGDAALLSDAAVVFEPDPRSLPAGLPWLRGPAGSHEEVLGRYQRLAHQLAPAGLTVAELRLDERRAWRAVLADGVELSLGSGDSEPAVERFAAAFPRIARAEDARLVRVDLRYPNGFALAWGQPAKAQAGI